MRPEEIKLEKLGVLQARILLTILVVGTSSRRGIGFFFCLFVFVFLVLYSAANDRTTFFTEGNRVRLK